MKTNKVIKPIKKQLILVHYVGVGDTSPDKVKEVINRAKKEVGNNKKLKNHIMYFVPIRGESRIECIYPKK